MSQGAEIINPYFTNLLRTAYLRILPILRPAVEVAILTCLGAVQLGPAGIFAGGSLGAAVNHHTIRRWIGVAPAVVSNLIHIVNNNPLLLLLARNLYEKIRRFLSGDHEENLIMSNPAFEN